MPASPAVPRPTDDPVPTTRTGSGGRRRWFVRLGPLVAVLLLSFAGALLAGCGDTGSEAAGDPQAGRQLAEARNCLVCHSVDGRPGLGPTWQGLWGSEVELTDGTVVVVDEVYVAEAVRDPQASSRADFAGGGMPAADLSDEELADLVAYLQDLQDTSAP